MIRLQRYLAESGRLSRHEAEQRIAEGRVTVNGTVATPGTMVDPDKDRIKLDMETVRPTRHHLVLMMHKPRGVVCTEKDPEGRRNVNSLLPDLPVHVHSVGRLDLMSEGLLLFTNDGDLTRMLTRAASGIERVYEVKIQGGVPAWALERLERGVNLEDGRARAASCRRLRLARTNEWLEVTMTEGRYREVRRMFQTLGMNVLKLKRVRFGAVRLGKLPVGAVRALTPDEITALTENRPPKPERPAKPPKAAKPGKPRRDARPARPGKTGRPARPERPGKPDRPDRPERPARAPSYPRAQREDRRPRDEDDEGFVSRAAARKFESEVAEAVRKAQAQKGNPPADRKPAGGSPDRARGHADRDGPAKRRADKGPGRPTGRPPRAERASRPEGSPTRHGSHPAKPSRPGPVKPPRQGTGKPHRPAKPARRPARPAGRPQRSVHANKPQKV